MRFARTRYPGVTDARVVLERAGRLEGAVVFGTRLDPRWIWMRVKGRLAAADALSPGTWGSEVPPPDDVGVRELTPGWTTIDGVHIPAEDGVQPFLVNDLRPGTASLEVMIGNDPDPLLTLPSIVIRPGETTRVSETGRIDIRELVRFVEVSVKDGAPGASPERLDVREFRGHDRQTADSTDRNVGASEWPVHVGIPTGVKSRLDLEIRAAGRRHVRLDDARGAIDVSLEPLLPVRVRLPNDMKPPTGDGWLLRAHPVHDETKRYFLFPRDFAGVTGTLVPELLLELPSMGRWSVTLSKGQTVVAGAVFEVIDAEVEERVVTLEPR